MQTTHPQLPTNPQFYRRLLDHLPTPVVVIDGTGRINYANHAMVELSGWQFDEGLGKMMLEFVHPDDAGWVIEAFLAVTDSADAQAELGAGNWTSLRFRMVSKDGATIPVEVIAGGGLEDPDVQGIMYSVRPASHDVLMDAVVTAIAAGDPLETIMRLVLSIVELPPFGLKAAVFEQRSDGDSRLVATSDDRFTLMPARAIDPVPWAGLGVEPRRVGLNDLTEPARSVVADLGGVECFTCGAHAPDMSSTLRLVAVAAVEQVLALGVLQLMDRTRELLSVVLMKSHNDRLLAGEAARDDLTGLPNRLGLFHRFQRITTNDTDAAMFFVDLDDFKAINDRYGHQVGDRALAAVADRLRRAVRAQDLVSRLGGDEFAVVVSEPKGRLPDHLIVQLADRVVSMLAEPLAIDGRMLPLAASVGVARLASSGDLEQLMSDADQAMYEAKRAGGGRHHIARPASH